MQIEELCTNIYYARDKKINIVGKELNAYLKGFSELLKDEPNNPSIYGSFNALFNSLGREDKYCFFSYLYKLTSMLASYLENNKAKRDDYIEIILKLSDTALIREDIYYSLVESVINKANAELFIKASKKKLFVELRLIKLCYDILEYDEHQRIADLKSYKKNELVAEYLLELYFNIKDSNGIKAIKNIKYYDDKTNRLAELYLLMLDNNMEASLKLGRELSIKYSSLSFLLAYIERASTIRAELNYLYDNKRYDLLLKALRHFKYNDYIMDILRLYKKYDHYISYMDLCLPKHKKELISLMLDFIENEAKNIGVSISRCDRCEAKVRELYSLRPDKEALNRLKAILDTDSVLKGAVIDIYKKIK